MPDLRAVIFDLDDTLHRERRFVLSGLSCVAQTIEQRYGVSASVAFRLMQATLRRDGRRAVLQTVCRALGVPVREIPGWVALVRSHQPRLRLPRETDAVLRALRRDGYRLGILTNGLVSTQRTKVRALDLESRVDAVVYADEHAAGGKPHPDCFQAILLALDVTPAHAAFVGDDLDCDVEGARRAGLQAIWLHRAGGLDGVRRAAGPTAQRLAEVPSIVQVLDGRTAHAC